MVNLYPFKTPPDFPTGQLKKLPTKFVEAFCESPHSQWIRWSVIAQCPSNAWSFWSSVLLRPQVVLFYLKNSSETKNLTPRTFFLGGFAWLCIQFFFVKKNLRTFLGGLIGWGKFCCRLGMLFDDESWPPQEKRHEIARQMGFFSPFWYAKPVFLNLLEVVGEKTKYSPKWWFNGDLPWPPW